MTTELKLMADIPVLAKSGRILHLSPNPEQLKSTAKRIGVLEVDQFEADIQAKVKRSGVYLVYGTLKAGISQACVRTLTPVKSSIDEAFSVIFMAKKQFNQFLETEEEGALEDVELLEDQDIDLAEIAVQYLSLSINPYPVSDGVPDGKDLSDNVTFKSEDQHREESSPFAVLKKLDKKG